LSGFCLVRIRISMSSRVFRPLRASQETSRGLIPFPRARPIIAWRVDVPRCQDPQPVWVFLLELFSDFLCNCIDRCPFNALAPVPASSQPLFSITVSTDQDHQGRNSLCQNLLNHRLALVGHSPLRLAGGDPDHLGSRLFYNCTGYIRARSRTRLGSSKKLDA